MALYIYTWEAIGTQHTPMTSYCPYLLFGLFTLTACQPVPADCSITYKSLTLCFNLTVGEMVDKYKLSYKPPGYYYRYLEDADSTLLVLHYKSQPFDFDNESQPATALYGREVDAYTFDMPTKKGLFDRQAKKLEALSGSRLTLSRQKTSWANYSSIEETTSLPNKGTFALAGAWTKDSILYGCGRSAKTCRKAI